MSEANPELTSLLNQLQEDKEPDAKVLRLIEYMEHSLAQPGSPHFKLFWEARKMALELFKDIANPQLRTQLWGRYSELSKEARRLKDLLDEESAFNVEQIDLAIQSLENDCAKIAEHLPAITSLDFSYFSQFLENEIAFFEPRQRELNVLNAYAVRITALRKELIKLEMRIRQKNKFFHRLSAVGDLVFPRRKELVAEVSDRFSECVKTFHARYFEKGVKESHFFLRDEIKGLQGAAKALTLSAQIFKDTRQSLSECWDILKSEEKELKKHRQEQKELYKAHCHELIELLKGIQGRFENRELSVHEAEKELQEFVHTLQDKELGRDEVRYLKDELHKVKDLVFAEAKKEEEARFKEAEKKEAERKAFVHAFQDKIKAFLEQAKELDLEAIETQKAALQEEISALTLSKKDKQDLEKELRPLKDLLVEKREAKLLDLPENDRQALLQLNELLQERKLRKKEQKAWVDQLKTEAGTSGLDMSRAFELSTQLAEEKEKLEHMNQGIAELERKIESYKRQLQN